jgi:hypothetical protein
MRKIARASLLLVVVALMMGRADAKTKDGVWTDRDCYQSNTIGTPPDPSSLIPDPTTIDPMNPPPPPSVSWLMVPPVQATMGTDERGQPDPGRGDVCLSDGHGNDVYAGGEIGTESSTWPSCGAIEVEGKQGIGVAPDIERHIFGDDNWGGSQCQ